MKLNQYYKKIILFFSIVMLFGKTHFPIDIEEDVILVINKKESIYHELDKDGLKYVHIGSENNIDDSIKIVIYSRVVIPLESKKDKKFGFLVYLDDQPPFELRYKKRNSNTKNKQRPGWTYSKPGIWHIYLPTKEDGYELTIQPLNKKKNTFIRVTSNTIKRKGKYSRIIKTINEEKKVKIETIKKNDGKEKITTSWYSLESEKQFQIKGPTKLRVFSRALMHNHFDTDYYIYIKEDGFDLGTFYFTTEKSDKSFVYNSKDSVSKWRSIWLSVPEGNHHYSFISPDFIENNNEVLIRMKQWIEK